MKLSRDKIQRMIDVGSGGSSGGVSSSELAGLLAGYATETWVDEHYISIDFFSRLFQAHGTENGSEIDVMPNDMETTITSVESMFGFWTNLYISALGSNGAAPAGISLGMLTDVTISGTPSAGQVLTFDDVSGMWVNGNAQAGATTLANLTDVTLTSPQTNQILIYDANTQKWVNSSVKTINGYSIFGTGDIPASGGGGGNYLPITGGRLTGAFSMKVGNYQELFFGYPSYNWNGNTSFPMILSGTVTGEIFLMMATPHIPFFQNGARNYGGSTLGSVVRHEGSTAEVPSWWDVGIPVADEFRIVRNAYHVNPSTMMRITNDGRMSVGDYLSGSKLTVSGETLSYGGGSGWQARVLSVNTSVGAAFIGSYSGLCAPGIYSHVASLDAWYDVGVGGSSIIFYLNGSTVGKWNGSGLGVGTGSPSYTLHVAGTIYATGAITALSDARKKDITGEADVSVEQIAHAPAVQFLWKDKERRKDGQQVGTLAQYWRTVLPEVVSDKGGELSMQYGVTALVSAIVTARKVVDHERRIHELEIENERLKKEVEQLRLN